MLGYQGSIDPVVNVSGTAKHIILRIFEFSLDDIIQKYQVNVMLNHS